MSGLFTRWLISAVSLLFVGYLVPGIEVKSFLNALIAAAILGILNAVVRPILVVLTLPLTVFTLGLFLFVINAVMLLIISAITDFIHIQGFWSALVGALIMSVISWLSSARGGERPRNNDIEMKMGPDGRWS